MFGKLSFELTFAQADIAALSAALTSAKERENDES